MKPIFPHAWDSTMVGHMKSCPQKLFRMYIEHWKPGEESVHLVAGKAFATGIEVARKEFYINGTPPAEAVAEGLTALLREYGTFECPPDSPKSPLRMSGALEFYFENYRLGHDKAEPVTYGGKRGIEFSFAHPLLDVLHPVTGDPIIYTGRADMVANAFGGVMVYDEKTASQLGPRWVTQWDLRSQFSGYCWALRQFGIKPAGVVTRGISILKTKYETQQAITFRAPWEMDRWYRETVKAIRRAIRMWESMDTAVARDEHDYAAWDYNLDHACTEYGGCALTRVCKSADPERWLPMYFSKRVWDPLAREETTLEEWNAKWLLTEQSTLKTSSTSAQPLPAPLEPATTSGAPTA